jgi:Spx/MgsR family transcriptional regulator
MSSSANHVVVYGLPKCSTCTKAQSWLRKHAIDFEFIDYKTKPIASDMLRAWGEQLGWDSLINRTSTTWRELPLTRKNPGSGAEYLLLVREYPTLIKRPLLVYGSRILQGYTDKLYSQFFNLL